MSYILDALRRADAERQHGQVPGLNTQASVPRVAPPPLRRSSLVWALLALVLVAAAGGAWWWAGRAYAGLQERSFAVASFHLLVRLGGSPEDGLDFLQARRGEPGMDADLQAVIDQAIAESQKSR